MNDVLTLIKPRVTAYKAFIKGELLERAHHAYTCGFLLSLCVLMWPFLLCLMWSLHVSVTHAELTETCSVCSSLRRRVNLQRSYWHTWEQHVRAASDERDEPHHVWAGLYSVLLPRAAGSGSGSGPSACVFVGISAADDEMMLNAKLIA